MKPPLDVIPHLDSLWRYARALTRSDADADDLVQESLAKALRSADSYDPDRPLLGWLIAIVRTTHQTRRRHVAAEAERVATLASLAPRDERPSQEGVTDLQTVMSVFEALPTEQREVLHLVAVLGFTYADAAEALDVPLGTVMSRLSRARANLRSRLDGPRVAADPQRLKIVGGRDGKV